MSHMRTFRLKHRVRAGVMSANPDEVARLDRTLDRELETSKVEDTVDDLTITGTLTHTGDEIGLNGATPVGPGGPFVQTYATADATLSAYTPDIENVAYSGIATGVGGTPYAQVTDLEALRAGYENLRAFTEDLAQQHNALLNFFQDRGDIT